MDNNLQTGCSRGIFSVPIVGGYLFLLIIGVVALAFVRGAGAAAITLLWSPVNNDPLVAGYEVHYGLASRQYQWVVVENASGAASSSRTVDNLDVDETYWFAVRARNHDGSLVSAYSNEVSATTPSPNCSGDTVMLTGMQFPPGEMNCQAAEVITTLGSVVVSATSLVTFSAQVIAFGPGFRVDAGGVVRAQITSGAVPRKLNEQGPLLTTAIPEVTESSKTGSLTQTGQHFRKVFSHDDFRARLAELGASMPDFWLNDDSTMVVFATTAALVETDLNGLSDVYLYDVLCEEFILVSRDALGNSGNGPSLRPRIDNKGERVVFESDAGDLIENDQNGVTDVYVYDWLLDQIDRASLTGTASESSSPAHNPVIGGEGRSVLFDREDTADMRQIYLYDVDSGYLEMEPFSFRQDNQGNMLDNHHPAISRNGKYVAYIEGLRTTDEVYDTCFVHMYFVPDDRYELTPCPRGVEGDSDVTLSFVEDDQWLRLRVIADGAVYGDPRVLYLRNAVWTMESQ